MDSLLAVADQVSIALKNFVLEQKQQAEMEKIEFENRFKELERQYEAQNARQSKLEQLLDVERQARLQLTQQVDRLELEKQAEREKILAEEQQRQKSAEKIKRKEQLELEKQAEREKSLAEEQLELEKQAEREKSLAQEQQRQKTAEKIKKKEELEKEADAAKARKKKQQESGDEEENEPGLPASSRSGAVGLKASRESRQAAQEGIKKRQMMEQAPKVNVVEKRRKVLRAGYHTAKSKEEQERDVMIYKFKTKMSSKLTASQMNQLEACYVKLISDGHYEAVILAGPDEGKKFSTMKEIVDYFSNLNPEEARKVPKKSLASKISKERRVGSGAGPSTKAVKPSASGISGVKKKRAVASKPGLISVPSTKHSPPSASATAPKMPRAESPVAGDFAKLTEQRKSSPSLTDVSNTPRPALTPLALDARAQNIKKYFRDYMGKKTNFYIPEFLEYLNEQVQFQGDSKCLKRELDAVLKELDRLGILVLDRKNDFVFRSY